jgi:hypothetical protein
VKGRFGGGLRYFPATVARADLQGGFDLAYADGDVELGVQARTSLWCLACERGSPFCKRRSHSPPPPPSFFSPSTRPLQVSMLAPSDEAVILVQVGSRVEARCGEAG